MVSLLCLAILHYKYSVLYAKAPAYGADASQYQYAPQIAGDASLGASGYSPERWGGGESAVDMAGGQYRHGPSGAGLEYQPRPVFKPESWRISTADRSRCLGIDDRGLDIAAQHDSGWQVIVLWFEVIT